MIGLFIYLLDPHQIDDNMWGVTITCVDKPDVALIPPQQLQTTPTNHEVHGNG